MLAFIRRCLRWLLHLVGGDTPPMSTSSPDQSTPTFPEPELGMGVDEAPDYRQRDSVLSPRERVFYRALLEAVKGDYLVFPKVRLADVVYLANEPHNRKYHNNQILCKHLDFVLCDRLQYRPALAVELDDSSHVRYSRQESDRFKEATLKAVGLPFLRLDVQPFYDVATLRTEIDRLLQGEAPKPG